MIYDLEDVHSKLSDTETAIKANTSARWWIFGLVVCFFVSPLTIAWRLVVYPFHTKMAYSILYGASLDNIVIDKHPTDCAFLTAPMGEKWCHYDRKVFSQRVSFNVWGGEHVSWRGDALNTVDVDYATSTEGTPIQSIDGGKTWRPNEYPQKHIATVAVSWDKVEE